MKKYYIFIPVLVLLFNLYIKLDFNKYKFEKKYYTEGKMVSIADYLISKSNDESITNYEDGNKSEMYTFNHPETIQTEALKDYRYIGDKPNNYFYFNCSDENNTSTCEIWRIIGVFTVEKEDGSTEKMVKIIRNRGIGNYSWNYTEGVAIVENINDWSFSSLQQELNTNYYNNLSDNSKSMVAAVKYYSGGADYHVFSTADELYSRERSNLVLENRTTSWTGKIGLMYASDYSYTYALGIDDGCYSKNCKENANPQTGWIYNSNINDGEDNISGQWTITPDSSVGQNSSFFSFFIHQDGRLISSQCGFCFDDVTWKFGVRPVLYLKNNIYVNSGEGTIDSPYTLSEIKEDENNNNSNSSSNSNSNSSNKSNIDNPETIDNIEIYIIIFSITIISLITIYVYKNKKEI